MTKPSRPVMSMAAMIVGVSEIDKAHDAVHHCIAQGNQSINTSNLNAVDELLQELTHVFSSNRRRGEDVPGPRRAEMPTSLGIDGRQVLLLAVLDLQNDCGFDRVAVFVELVDACHAREGRILHGIPDVRALDRAGSLERVEE